MPLKAPAAAPRSPLNLLTTDLTASRTLNGEGQPKMPWASSALPLPPPCWAASSLGKALPVFLDPDRGS